MSIAWSPQAQQYFDEHAIEGRVAAALGVRERNGELIYVCESREGGRFERRRPLSSDKTIQPQGVPLAAWWPLGIPENAGMALVCEGESDALAALSVVPSPNGSEHEAGRVLSTELAHVVSVPGTGYPAERLADDLVAAGVSEAVLGFDADKPGADYTAAVAAALHAKDILPRWLWLPKGEDLAERLAAERDRAGWLANALVEAEAVQDAELAEREPERAPSISRVLSPPSFPMEVAREFVGSRFTHPVGPLVLRHWRGGWWRWRTSHWGEIEHRAVRAEAYGFTEHAVYEVETRAGREEVPWAPNRHKIANLLEALAAVCHLPEETSQPGWIDGREHDGAIVACANGLLDVGNRELVEHDPRFFNQTAVPFAYNPAAPAPERWLRFLAELWPEDRDSIAALQEWFGYTISGRLDLHKILLLVGPTRGGKGVIARVLGALVGRENVAGPTLTSLGGDFGLAPLLGKPLAVISDARLNGRNSNVVVERLLSISGEDTITVNRKYRDQWTGKLPSRFVVISNELPALGDASAAIAGRFVALLLTRSWLGDEDHELEPALHAELPGILNWALDGLDRLTRSGRFTRPPATDEAMVALQDLASPVAAFVRDRCQLAGEVTVDELYGAWRSWAEDNGQRQTTKQTFGRDLRAVVPGLRVVRPREDDMRYRLYRGVELKPEKASP